SYLPLPGALPISHGEEADPLAPERPLLPEELAGDLRRQPHVGRAGLAAVDARRDDVAGDEGAAEERLTQRLAGPLEPEVRLGRGEDHAARRAHLGPPHLDVVTEPYAGVVALEAVEADDGEAGVGGVGGERDGGRRPLAGQRDDGAGAEAELRERLLAQPRDALADVGVLGAGHLEADGVGARGSVVGFRLVGHGEGRGPEGPAGTHGAVRGSRGSVVRGPWSVVRGPWSVVRGPWCVVPVPSVVCRLPCAPGPLSTDAACLSPLGRRTAQAQQPRSPRCR